MISTTESTSRREDMIYDVGMHRGEDTEFYLKKGFWVVGFEADPGLAEYCRSRFASAIEEHRLAIVEGAVVDPSVLGTGQRKIDFHRNLAVSVWGTTQPDWAKRNDVLGAHSSIIEVAVVDLAGCLRRFGMPHYMKIDIEGSDTACLKVLEGFSVRPRFVSMEAEKVVFSNLEREINLLDGLGYSHFKAVEQSRVSSQRVPNPAQEGVHATHTFPPGSSGLFGRELAGRWRTKHQILREYRRIFILYRLLGNYTLLGRSRRGRLILRRLSDVLRTPLPGWYDTHAMLQTAADPVSRGRFAKAVAETC